MHELKRILSNTSLFQMLDSYQLGNVVAASRAIYAGAETSVIEQGDKADGMFLVVYGQVRMGFQLKNGNEKTLAILGLKKCFGLGEMLLNREHRAFAKTTKDSMLLQITRDSILAAARENFAFSQELMTCIGRQFYTLLQDIESYSNHSAKQRLAGYLLRQPQSRTDNWIELAASKALIASRLSLTPGTFSRELHDLCDAGLIAVAGRRVRILDNARMNALVA